MARAVRTIEPYEERTGEVARPGMVTGRSAGSFWWEDVKKRVKGLPSAVEEMPTSELAERAAMALGPAMLKSTAVGKTAITGLRQGMGRKVWPWIREMLKVPRREYARIEDIRVKPPRGDLYGSFNTETGKIELYKGPHPRAETPVHELAHARQWIPELTESGQTKELMKLATDLEKRGIEPLVKNIPWEMHAESVAKQVLGKGRLSQREYDVAFRKFLGKAAKRARAITKDLPAQEEKYIDDLLSSVGL